MSRRTSEANKAIAIAWANEQKLVNEGQGTRDWTQDQQRDILERGKAYDENGKAFEGQHMKSVEKYPEYQGDPGNIQFLTKKEHLEAHGGSWQNPTNWYFDPVTKEITDFGEGKYTPCEVIDLSIPVCSIESNSHLDKCESDAEEPISKDTVPEEASAEIHERKPINQTKSAIKAPPPVSTSTELKKENAIWSGVKKAGKWIWDNKKTIGLFVGAVAAKAVLEKVAGESRSDSNFSDYSPRSNDYDTDYDSDSESTSDSYYYNDDSEAAEDDGSERSSPREHDVSGYDRQQNGKTVHVRPYKRGGRNNDEDE